MIMREEQANALIQPTQTQPVFFSRLERVCRHIANKVKSPTVKESSLFALGLASLHKSGTIFKDQAEQGIPLSNEPFQYDAAQSQFKMYLSEMGEYEGDTLHGVRTASAITMALGGADSSSLMTHVGWRNKSTAERYLRLDIVYDEKSPAAILQEEVSRSSVKANGTTNANTVRDRLDSEGFYVERNRG
ncbi:hypothetical protein Bbelb_361780 [Branchiostoma belcheri]|nr:hypothetical protein Bbelb_361780 [Branchiostoma belcheri]